MKHKLLAVLCLLSFAAPLRADLESDRAALRVLKSIYEEACKTGDPQKLAPHLTTNATAVMVTGEEVAGMAGIQQYWAKIQSLMGPGGTYATTINVDQTEIFGDLSLSRGTTDDQVQLATGRQLKFTSRWTAICLRQTNGWKIHRLQASLDPIQNVFIATRVSAAKISFGLGGLTLGAIAAAVLLRRKNAD